MTTMHKNGIYYTQYGSIFSRYNDSLMLDEDVTILIDKELGTLLKIGKKQNVTNYFNTMCDQYIRHGIPEMTENLQVITFHVKYPELEFEPDGYNFDIDEVCTIINWFNNHLDAETIMKFLHSSLDDMKTKIKELQAIGL